MHPSHDDDLNAAFAALADPTRRAILARLAQGETSVGDLVKPFSISGPAISRHLRVLENARLIERRIDAQWRICRLHPPGLQAADDWLAQYRTFWDNSLDRLVEVLEHDGTAGKPAPADAPRGGRWKRRLTPDARKPKPDTPARASRTPTIRKRKSP